MSFNTITINSATPAKAASDAMKTIIDNHPAWEFVETVAGSTAGWVAEVFRCLGTLNGLGANFFMAIVRSSDAGLTLGFVMAEDYNATTKQFIRGAPVGSGVLTVEADLSYGTPRHVANENSIVANVAGNLRAAGNVAATNRTGFTLVASISLEIRLSVTNSRILAIMARPANSTYVGDVYVGAYDSFHATELDPFPIYCGRAAPINPSWSEHGGFTRDIISGSSSGNPFHGMPGFYWTHPRGGHVGTVAQGMQEGISNRFWPSRIPVMSISGGNQKSQCKGLLKPDVLMTMHPTNQATFPGDTITIDGVIWEALTFSANLGTYYDIQFSGGNIIQAYVQVWCSRAA